MLDKKQWTLVTLAMAEGQPLTPAQLQKTVFLLGKTLSSDVIPEDFYNFSPYNYGPFDAQVYADARLLEHEGYASIQLNDENRYKVYSATDAGVREGSKLSATLPSDVREYVSSIVNWVQRQSFTQLVSAIYRKYPEYKVNSVFRES